MGRLASDVATVLPAAGVTSAVALVGATGVAVGVGVVVSDGSKQSASDPLASDSQVAAALAPLGGASGGGKSSPATPRDSAGQTSTEPRQVSRGSSRPPLASVQRATKSQAMPVAKQSMGGGVTETLAPATPQDVAIAMLGDYGWSTSEFGCLNELYLHESGWNPSAENPTSGAYGIPQALPADKMAAYGDDWQTNPTTQLEWGLSYIRDSYGSPCGAWGFWQSNSWY